MTAATAGGGVCRECKPFGFGTVNAAFSEAKEHPAYINDALPPFLRCVIVHTTFLRKQLCPTLPPQHSATQHNTRRTRAHLLNPQQIQNRQFRSEFFIFRTILSYNRRRIPAGKFGPNLLLSGFLPPTADTEYLPTHSIRISSFLDYSLLQQTHDTGIKIRPDPPPPPSPPGR